MNAKVLEMLRFCVFVCVAMTLASAQKVAAQTTVCERPAIFADDLAAPGFNPPAPSPQGYFANHISMNGNGDMALIGETGGGGTIQQTGGPGWVRVFERDGDEWLQTDAFRHAPNPEPSDAFGASVGISGGRAIITAPGRKNASQVRVGAVYFFEYDEIEEEWDQIQEIMNPNNNHNDLELFGGSVTSPERAVIDGLWAAVSATGASVDDGEDEVQEAGLVYVYRFDGQTWSHFQTLSASVPISKGWFGTSLALSGKRLIVGEPAIGNSQEAGLAHIFQYDTGLSEWVVESEIAAPDSHPGDSFGNSVSMDGGKVLVGAPYFDATEDSAGRAFMFRLNTTGEWVEYVTLAPSDTQDNQHFGSKVSISGSFAVVGATNYEIDSKSGAGAAYVFQFQSTGTWDEVLQLRVENPLLSDNMGWSIAVRGDQVMVGAALKAAPGIAFAGALTITPDLPNCPQ